MCFVSVRLRVSIAGSYFWLYDMLDYFVILWLSYLPTTDAPIKESANVEQTGFFFKIQNTLEYFE